MGAHTLGKARSDASGYQGPWLSVGATSFDNGFYQMLKNDAVFWKKRVRKYRLWLTIYWTIFLLGDATPRNKLGSAR